MAATNTSLSIAPATARSSGNGCDTRNMGCLTATVLSAYDLPLRDPPSHVEITMLGQTAVTGPPSQRHKDRNSFKFTPAGTNSNPNSPRSSLSTAPTNGISNTLQIKAPLPDLYKSTVRVAVVYGSGAGGDGTASYVADYKVKHLLVSETKWLILHLHTPAEQKARKAQRAAANKKKQQQLIEASGGSTGASSASPVGLEPSSSSEDDDEEDDDGDDVTPTLRLHMKLDGPYRPEIGALIHAADMWFSFVDSMESQTKQVVSLTPGLPFDKKFLLIPGVGVGVPVITTLVVASPILIGIFTIGLPIFLPVAVVVGVALVLLGLTVAGLAASTEAGRSHVGGAVAPCTHFLLSTPVGQNFVYPTGPRPTPVLLARAVLPTGLWSRLITSLFIDLLGSASYLLPFVGELGDAVWAPLQTVLIMALYDNDVSKNLKYVSFAEEILPFTDVMPTATTGWFMEFALPSLMSAINNKDGGGGGADGASNNNPSALLTQAMASAASASASSGSGRPSSSRSVYA